MIEKYTDFEKRTRVAPNPAEVERTNHSENERITHFHRIPLLFHFKTCSVYYSLYWESIHQTKKLC